MQLECGGQKQAVIFAAYVNDYVYVYLISVGIAYKNVPCAPVLPGISSELHMTLTRQE